MHYSDARVHIMELNNVILLQAPACAAMARKKIGLALTD